MQTFVPYQDFQETAACLDYRRLGKQRVECKQIYKALTEENYGWKNHPATKMWRGYGAALCSYAVVICTEWISRGYKDTLLPFFQSRLPTDGEIELPPWYGRLDVHLSHRSNLVRKLPSHYRTYWPDVADDLPYVWPV